jgi:hypothetical protein
LGKCVCCIFKILKSAIVAMDQSIVAERVSRA